MKIMLVDDHTLFLEGLQYVLKINGIEVIGMARNGLDALNMARVLKPDVILMDIRMPGLSGLNALRLIKAEMPEINIIMLTISEEDDDLFEAVKYGASGYLLKNTDVKALTQMLTDIENGESSLSRELAFKLLKEFKHEGKEGMIRYAEEAKKESLNRRQLEVLEMVAKGATYKEVGEALGLTERTVKYHMGRIIELLHLENRTQVIAYAVRTGLVKMKKAETP